MCLQQPQALRLATLAQSDASSSLETQALRGWPMHSSHNQRAGHPGGMPRACSTCSSVYGPEVALW